MTNTVRRTRNPNTLTPRTTKVTVEKPRWFDEYTDLMTFKKLPVHDMYLDRLAQELMAWVREDDTAMNVKEFLFKKGIHYEDYRRFISRHDNLRIADQEARRFFGVRRENGAIRRIYDSTAVLRSLPMLDSEWKENVEWQSNLKQKEVQEQRQTIVVLEKFPEKS
jgi:hypothetical protein